MKKLLILVAVVSVAGCVGQATPKQGTTTQGISAPRDAASGSTGK